MKKIIWSAVFMFVVLFFLIVKLSSQGTQATQTTVTSTNSLSTTQNMGTNTMNQKQAATSTTTRPMTSRATRTS